MKIYSYKLSVDNGGVPFVENNIFSLSICKPKIRKYCNIGDIIGISGKI